MNRTPLLFIHGPWLHATSWQPWIEHFTQRGYAPIAPGWPGQPPTVEAARRHPEAVAELELDDITDHYTRIARLLPAPPVIIGHSVGGLIAQKLLGHNLAQAAIAIAPAPINGVPVPRSPTHACSNPPQLNDPYTISQPITLTAEQFRHAFAHTLTPEESAALFVSHTVPAPNRHLLEPAFANGTTDTRTAVDTNNTTRGPLLLISGQEDRLVPDITTRTTYKLYGDSTAITELKQYPDRCHSLTIDSGWHTIADHISTWLTRHYTPTAY
ncbi:alpha/beta hydrolase [Streptomyces sp. NPDC005708]|uniref:alpha/beta hydrolase n=1 Tax=Streptomyces sp. NPDC005708 TaxID=3154564 RepID=UPI0033D3E338